MSSKSHEKPIAVYGALLANVAIAVAKFIAAGVTGSSAMLSEGIHSVADTSNQLLLLLGLKLSKRPSDDRHPYGHGKELYFWSLIVAIVLFGIGGGMSIYEGIVHLQHPEPMQSAMPSLVVLGIAFVFESVSLLVGVKQLRKTERRGSLWRAMRRSKDPSAFMVVGEDSAAVAGIVMAAAGILASHVTGRPEYDGIASLGVGSILCVVAILLAAESRALLIGESSDPALVRSVTELATNDPAVCRAGRPLTMQLGPDEVLLNMELEFRSDLTSGELRDAVERIERKLRQAHRQIRVVYLEAASLGAPREGTA